MCDSTQSHKSHTLQRGAPRILEMFLRILIANATVVELVSGRALSVYSMSTMSSSRAGPTPSRKPAHILRRHICLVPAALGEALLCVHVQTASWA